MEENYKGYADGEVTISSREYRDLIEANMRLADEMDRCRELEAESVDRRIKIESLKAEITDRESEIAELKKSKDSYWRWYKEEVEKVETYADFLNECGYKDAYEEWKEEKNGNKDNN